MSEAPAVPLAMRDIAFVAAGTRIIDAIDLVVAPAERVAIVGENGVGKSLLARLAAGLEMPTAGSVALFGTALDALDRDALRRVRSRCGLALQGGSLFGDLSVEDNLRIGFGAAAPRAERLRRRIDRLLVDFEIEHAARRLARTLSIGEQRRVELARAFLRDPELLILDEPFAGARVALPALEAQVRRQVVPRGRALLLITQDEALAARLATRVLRLDRGRLVQQPAPASLPLAAS